AQDLGLVREHFVEVGERMKVSKPYVTRRTRAREMRARTQASRYVRVALKSMSNTPYVSSLDSSCIIEVSRLGFTRSAFLSVTLITSTYDLSLPATASRSVRAHHRWGCTSRFPAQHRYHDYGLRFLCFPYAFLCRRECATMGDNRSADRRPPAGQVRPRG